MPSSFRTELAEAVALSKRSCRSSGLLCPVRTMTGDARAPPPLPEPSPIEGANRLNRPVIAGRRMAAREASRLAEVFPGLPPTTWEAAMTAVDSSTGAVASGDILGEVPIDKAHLAAAALLPGPDARSVPL